MNPTHNTHYYAGIDIGTTGCRIAVISLKAQSLSDNTSQFLSYSEDSVELIYEDRIEWPEPTRQMLNGASSCTQEPTIWWNSVNELLLALSRYPSISSNIQALTIDGTSTTVLPIDQKGTPIDLALMYSDNSCLSQAKLIQQYAPNNSPAQGAGSSLAKWLYFYQNNVRTQTLNHNKHKILHQTDWIIGQLCGHYHYSDEHNCLKLGYDNIQQIWPDWLTALLNDTTSSSSTTNIPTTPPSATTTTSTIPTTAASGKTSHFLLPQLKQSGAYIATISKALCKRYQFNAKLKILAGTTDSTASFIASGANNVGDAVTSLGSTLVLKVLSSQAVFSSQHGIYSHRLGPMWLVGGASNSGGAALKKFFTTEQIHKISSQIDLTQPTHLHYYPLPAVGERFPIADRQKQSNTSPRPHNDNDFLHALLQGIATIEKQGYDKLQALGGPSINRIITTGGGAQNETWLAIRKNELKLPIVTAQHQQAAYGSALIALNASVRLSE
ncbi:Carbohydrate kinase, FGGY family [hydrothermal vent metagenome]|uniref:Carbohydrate kinase, FGGY family n=1 Tax=hydrothermal vent metagenome TaxID=652676 RepID=A0A3B0Y4G2_9ZZZZ